MRGWIMTVATLFVGMSFQALSQRPSWMTDPKGGIKFFDKNGNSTDHASNQTGRYVILNTITFSMSLVMVVVLMLPNILPARHTMTAVTVMMTVLAMTVALNYSFMISMDDRTVCYVLLIILIYSILTVLLLALSKKLLTYSANRRQRHRPVPDV
ncbi:hypothetical protein QOZ80_5BG0451810 [Eleusine coracana subsp. coracana]|nr:hypothetical protein QOZ80_5BG0451810 [Eleusine coracana subsp. coracana]